MRVVDRIRPEDLVGANVGHVICQGCHSLIALELEGVDPSIYGDETLVVPIGSRLLTARMRADQTPDGKPMIGWQCACGNDTRLSEAELHHEPAQTWRGDVTNAEQQQVTKDIAACGEHAADYEETSRQRRYESFVVRRP